MEFYAVVNRRRTVRAFLPRPVEDEKVMRVLDAGLKAPSGGHLREWEFVLLRDPENRRKALIDALKARDLRERNAIEDLVKKFDREELKDIYRRVLPVQLTMMLEAPELLAVCYRMGKPLAEVKTLFELNSLASVWCCIENVVLAMAAEGLYGCTYTPYETQRLKEYLGIPQDYEVATLIPFGYPKQPPPEAEPVNVKERLHIDRWQLPAARQGKPEKEGSRGFCYFFFAGFSDILTSCTVRITRDFIGLFWSQRSQVLTVSSSKAFELRVLSKADQSGATNQSSTS